MAGSIAFESPATAGNTGIATVTAAAETIATANVDKKRARLCMPVLLSLSLLCDWSTTASFALAVGHRGCILLEKAVVVVTAMQQ